MKALEEEQQNDFVEIIEDRHGRKATIIACQLPVSKWYDVIGNEVIADAILDRIVHSSYQCHFIGNKQDEYGRNGWMGITEIYIV